MDQMTLKNFRCFREEQTARLAPLTLLVGENSTGKTSFLALIRSLVRLAVGYHLPDFKEEPYDLGSFDEIVYHGNSRRERIHSFEAGFSTTSSGIVTSAGVTNPFSFQATFKKHGTVPFPVRKWGALGEAWYEETYDEEGYVVRAGTKRGSWELRRTPGIRPWYGSDDYWVPFILAFRSRSDDQSEDDEVKPLDGAPAIHVEDWERLQPLAHSAMPFPAKTLTYASAPVRSKPRRTYDPSRITAAAEGDHVPMYLAHVSSQDTEEWATLKRRLEEFGQASGLFDEISVKRLGKRGGEPFQLEIRKYGRRAKGPYHNLIDVGYGVSQSLPVITELLRDDTPSMFLLQQPEVHLHPQAQAELGTLFCQVAGTQSQLIIETHSDHLIDRVRMDVRDGTTNLKPEDVSILYFERNDMDANIYSIRIDEQGNILDAPEGYRKFFLEETTRSLWKRRLS